MRAEIKRTSDTTTWAGTNLLNGGDTGELDTLKNFDFQVGAKTSRADIISVQIGAMSPKALGFDDDGSATYSLRHYALQTRLNKSDGKVNIYDLARNAGTSVNQLERFYLKRMKVSKKQRENLNRFDSIE